MKDKIRLFLWKLLGIEYFKFLKGQNKKYITNNQFSSKTYHNGAYYWQWDNKSRLKIGKYCSIANDVNFILDEGFHTLSKITSFPLFNHIQNEEIVKTEDFITFKNQVQSPKKNIIIGNDVWISMGVTVLPGVVIGNGVTVLSGAVVSKDVPDYAIVAGVPAQIKSFKYDQETIAKMCKIAWWDWSENKVEENWKDFYMSLEDFIIKWDK